MTIPPVTNENLGYRFEVEGEVVEVVGSEGVRRDPKTLGKYTTFQVPGGSQALSRTEVVRVSLDGGPPVELRRPACSARYSSRLVPSPRGGTSSIPTTRT